jgi:hypothetical protein
MLRDYHAELKKDLERNRLLLAERLGNPDFSLPEGKVAMQQSAPELCCGGSGSSSGSGSGSGSSKGASPPGAVISNCTCTSAVKQEEAKEAPTALIDVTAGATAAARRQHGRGGRKRRRLRRLLDSDGGRAFEGAGVRLRSRRLAPDQGTKNYDDEIAMKRKFITTSKCSCSDETRGAQCECACEREEEVRRREARLDDWLLSARGGGGG